MTGLPKACASRELIPKSSIPGTINALQPASILMTISSGKFSKNSTLVSLLSLNLINSSFCEPEPIIFRGIFNFWEALITRSTLL